MNHEFHQQIYNELNLRETDDLLVIWQENNHFEWSDDAFEVISEILKARGVDIPQQDEAKYEQDATEDHKFSDEELKIIDDENPPDFYDPFEVLKVSKWIDLAVKVMTGLIIVQNLLNISTSWRIAQSYFVGSKYFLGAYPVTFLIVAVDIAIGILLIYAPLKFLSQILRILMEMEFRSRKVN
jgi:hypothetical protein